MNKKLMTPLFLLASFLLVGCSTDTIVARPTWQNDNIIEGNKDLKDNKMKAIYDAIKNLGDTNANVLSKVMTDIAISHIGEFEKLQEFGSKTNLNDIKALITTEDFKNFVKAHNIYKADTEGATRNGATTQVESLNEEQQGLTSFYKIQQQYNRMVEDVYERLYNEIKGGSYSTTKTKLFQEQYFIDYLEKELYEVKKPSSFTAITNKVFLPKKKETTWKEYVNNVFLKVTDTNGNLTGVYDDYIGRKILPEVYKTCLTETYVREQRYSSLGRSYARKVNMVSITTDDTNKYAVPKMLKYFANEYLVKNNAAINYNFDLINEAMIGIVKADSGAEKLLIGDDNSNPNFARMNLSYKEVKDQTSTDKVDSEFLYIPQTKEDGSDAIDDSEKIPTKVYEGTKLADLVKKISTCCDLKVDKDSRHLTYTRKQFLNTEQQKAYDELTGNQHTIEKGILLKEREIRQTDYTKDGWFLKNGGLTDISSTIRDRLFNITTSTQIDDYGKKSGKNAESKDYIKYFGITNEETPTPANVKDNKAFLTMPTQSGSDVDRIVLNEAGNSNYYIIEVEEAVNTSKLSKANNKDSYIRTKSFANSKDDAYLSTNTYNELVRDIVKVNASSDTYKKNANEYYLMISNIVFYDQSVYDYFKSQFPDLFK